MVQTIQTDLGMPINHYVEINFDTFQRHHQRGRRGQVLLPDPRQGRLLRCSASPAPGCYSLTGDQALAFVRSRHYEYYQNGYWHFEGESDLARIQRQQAFIKKMIKKAEGEFTNPIALNSVIGGITKNLTVDSGFSPSLMLSLVKDFRSMDVSTIPNLTLPTYCCVTSGGRGRARPAATAGRPDDRRVQRLRQPGPEDRTTSTSRPAATPANTRRR